MIRFQHHAHFFTATNLNWLYLLQNNFLKQIVVEALRNRVVKNQLTIYAFVMTPNHFHIVWQIHDNIEKEAFQRDLLKFVARSILNFMRMHRDPLLPSLKVNAADRAYQVWERNFLSIDLFTEKYSYKNCIIFIRIQYTPNGSLPLILKIINTAVAGFIKRV